MQIKGKTTLITGAAKRIGRDIALNLAKDGSDIVIHYNSSDTEANSLKREIEALGVKAYIIKSDLTDQEQLKKFVKDVLETVHIDILINNASIYYRTPLESASFEDLDKFYNIHVKAPFYLSKIFGKKMYERKEGRIINIIDYSAILPYPDYTPYTISKGAMITMTKAFAKELAPYVLVNGVLPGPIIPPENLEDKEIPLKKTILKRWAGGIEVYKAVKYLIETDFTTGSFIPVEGGRLIF
ncbi:MAG: SDR family NAD(P)-dependent oxidoreductase [Hydrogenothermaceae bacterium]